MLLRKVVITTSGSIIGLLSSDTELKSSGETIMDPGTDEGDRRSIILDPTNASERL